MRRQFVFLVGVGLSLALSTGARADFSFTTGAPDGKIATLTQPPDTGKLETETADDFILPSQTLLSNASFTGLLVGAGSADVNHVTVDIYRVFPNDSDLTRTITVPTRTNSPGDVEIDGRDTANNDMTFSTTILAATFAAANSVVSGINPSPTQTTGGEGAVSGTEVRFDVTFNPPINLAPDHYFFRPEVGVGTGEFLWLSAAKPTVPPFAPDLQSWIRNSNLAPDWVRIGADVVGGDPAPAFNASFAVSGQTVASIPLPPAAWSGIATIAVMGFAKLRKHFAR